MKVSFALVTVTATDKNFPYVSLTNVVSMLSTVRVISPSAAVDVLVVVLVELVLEVFVSSSSLLLSSVVCELVVVLVLSCCIVATL